MIPRLFFRRSWVYDDALARKRGFLMPSDRTLDNHVRVLERAWKKHGKAICTTIARVTKLEWCEKEIVCYITAGVYPFSDPMTLNPSADIDTLTHELIHRILSEPQNIKRIQKQWSRLIKQYRREEPNTRRHIGVHAIEEQVVKKIFGPRRLEKIKKEVPLRDYLRAWELVERDGAENIVTELTRGR